VQHATAKHPSLTFRWFQKFDGSKVQRQRFAFQVMLGTTLPKSPHPPLRHRLITGQNPAYGGAVADLLVAALRK
jgi:hypothetical protein